MLSYPAVIHIAHHDHNRKCYRYSEYLPDPCNISIVFILLQKECRKNSTQDFHQSDHQNCFPRHLRSVDLIHLHTDFNRIAHLTYCSFFCLRLCHSFFKKSPFLVFDMIFHFTCDHRTHLFTADLACQQFQIITSFQSTHLRSPVK